MRRQAVAGVTAVYLAVAVAVQAEAADGPMAFVPIAGSAYGQPDKAEADGTWKITNR